MKRESLKRIAESRNRKPWRGKDLKKLLPIPWSVREVVFTCSNGWTIERIHPDDTWIEGVLMGHCMGLHNGRYCGQMGDARSLRDEHGIPHVTLDHGRRAVGRCNMIPPQKYMQLIHEWKLDVYAQTDWDMMDDDVEYHEGAILSDRDYRDLPTCFPIYRDANWREKRASV